MVADRRTRRSVVSSKSRPPGAHPALRPRRGRASAPHNWPTSRDPTEPPSGVRRQPLLRGAKTLKYHPRLPGPSTSPLPFWYNTEHRHGGFAMLTPSTSSQSTRAAGAARRPFKQPGPVIRTLRSRDPTTAFARQAVLDQPTCDTLNRRNCSVNRNRHCLEVVDRLRADHINDCWGSEPCVAEGLGPGRARDGFPFIPLQNVSR